MKKNARKTKGNQPTSFIAQLMLPLAALMRGDLRDLVVTFGMQAMESMLEQERIALCGPHYEHNAFRTATRAGSTRGRRAWEGGPSRSSARVWWMPKVAKFSWTRGASSAWETRLRSARWSRWS